MTTGVVTVGGVWQLWLTLSRVFPARLVLDPEFFWGGQELSTKRLQGSCIVLEAGNLRQAHQHRRPIREMQFAV